MKLQDKIVWTYLDYIGIVQYTVPPVTREVTVTHSLWIGAPRVCPLFVSFPFCHCLCIRSFVPCHWNAGLLCLVGLKEYGLGTHSLGLNCPLSEVGTPPSHNSGMAYSLETENNNIVQYNHLCFTILCSIKESVSS